MSYRNSTHFYSDHHEADDNDLHRYAGIHAQPVLLHDQRLTEAEAATRLGISTNALAKRRRAGRGLDCERVIGGRNQYYYALSTVLAALAVSRRRYANSCAQKTTAGLSSFAAPLNHRQPHLVLFAARRR